jgi:hypothetical protein
MGVEHVFELAVEGKRADLATMEPRRREVLEILKRGYDEALNNAPENLGRSYFDFIDDDSVDAVAVRRHGYSFVGVTTGLIDAILGRAVHILGSAEAIELIGIKEQGQLEGLGDVVLHLVLNFVILHEQAHHRFGHTGSLDVGVRLHEFATHAGGDVEGQVDEVLCDGWAVYNLSQSLVSGPIRSVLASTLHMESDSDEAKDQVLFSLMVVAISGFFLLHLEGPHCEAHDVLTATHPPSTVRMDFNMRHLQLWAAVNRPAVVDWMTKERFRALTRASVQPTEIGAIAKQLEFMRSSAGQSYYQELCSRIDQAKAKLP